MSPLAYLEAGDGEQSVLLIHGNFAGKTWWREVLESPPYGSRLLAPDLPGFGESAGVRGFSPSMSRYAQSLIRFLDGVGARRPVLVGHSFGAAVAVELALTDPGRFPACFYSAPHLWTDSIRRSTSIRCSRATGTTGAASVSLCST